MNPQDPQDPQMAANEVLAGFWNGDLPLDLSLTAAHMGVRLVGHRDECFLHSCQLTHQGGTPAIHVNLNESSNRQRFAIAHALGHVKLGHAREISDYPSNFSGDITNPSERAANEFALALLMPADAIKLIVKRGYARDIDHMASMCQVSSMAMGVRLSRLFPDNF